MPVSSRRWRGFFEGEGFESKIDEQIIFSQLNDNVNAVWSLLLATGYLRIDSLDETVRNALEQTEEKHYSALLETKGIAPGRIRKYGFAFQGKECLIG